MSKEYKCDDCGQEDPMIVVRVSVEQHLPDSDVTITNETKFAVKTSQVLKAMKIKPSLFEAVEHMFESAVQSRASVENMDLKKE